MGTKYIEGTVRSTSGEEADVRSLVDSGATYTLIPTQIWEFLGLEATREQTPTLVDGSQARRRISNYYLILPQCEDYSEVILGEPGDEVLLSVVTLDILGLLFNSFNQTLQPMSKMLA